MVGKEDNKNLSWKQKMRMADHRSTSVNSIFEKVSLIDNFLVLNAPCLIR